MANPLRVLLLVFGSTARFLLAILLPLMIIGGLSVAHAKSSPRNSPFKQLTSSEEVWDGAQTEVEVVSNQLELEAEWVERLIGVLEAQEFATPQYVTVHTEAHLPIFSPVAKYGRLFSLPPPPV